MFAKLGLFIVASMAALTSATPQDASYGGVAPTYGGSYGTPSYGTPSGGEQGGDIKDSCNTGPVQCCNQSFQSKSEALDYFKGVPSVVDVLVGPITGQIGAHCSPISVLAIAGNSCSSQPVCCSGNHFSGLVAVGCSPVNANL